MTNQFPTPTSAYSNDNTSTEFDFFSSRRFQNYRPLAPASQPHFRAGRVNRNDDSLYWFELTVDDVSGGLDCLSGYYDETWNRTWYATADCRFPRKLVLSTEIADSGLASTSWSTNIGVHSCNIFSTLAIGIGSVANKSLYIPTSTSNPTVSARTFSPGSAISSLSRVILNNIEYLAVGMKSTAVYLMSDLGSTPTSPGSMHANSAGCWGIIQTPLPGSPLLVYANGNIYNNLTASSAIGTAPTASNLTNVPNGGYAIGIIGLGGGPLRAYWYMPTTTNTNGDLAGSNLGRVMHCNLEGTDLQELKFPGLRGILSAAIWQDGIVGTDGTQVYWHRGVPINLNWATDRDNTIGASPLYPQVRGFHIDGEKLLVQVSAYDGSTTVQPSEEEFDPETGRWNIRHSNYLITTDASSLRASGSYPYNITTQVAYVPYGSTTGVMLSMYVPEYGKETDSLFRGLVGSTLSGNATSSFAGYRSSGGWYSPLWQFRGFEGWPKAVSHIIFGGDLWVRTTNFDDDTHVSSDASVQVRVGGISGATSGVVGSGNGVTATFNVTSGRIAQIQPVPASIFDKLQMDIFITRGTADSDHDRTPQALPVIVKGFMWKPKELTNYQIPPQPTLSYAVPA